MSHLDACLRALQRLHSRAYLAGPSAAAVWDLPLLTEPDLVTVGGITRGRYSGGLRVAPGNAQTCEHRGLLVTNPAWTVVGCARLLPRHEALMVADAAAHRSLCTIEELKDLMPGLRGTHGVGRVRWIVENADPAAESPGETWTRLILKGLGHQPRSQVVIKDDDFIARVDFLLGEHLVIEFDGAIKYQGPDAMNEKRRQARLESLGYRVMRLIWEQLADPLAIDRRVRAAGVQPTGRRLPTWLLAG